MNDVPAGAEIPPMSPAAAPTSHAAPPLVDPPPLARDRSFWGLTITQFLGAFNDNVYKQLLLLLFVAVPSGDGETHDLQFLAILSFSLPFVLFSGLAGYLADKYSKRTIIVLCKVAEVGITLVAVAAFFVFAQVHYHTLIIAAFCLLIAAMGTHSTFFGPSKYGILPETLRERDLPAANGFVLMTTFLAIIFGMALAGLLRYWLADDLWPAGLIFVGIAVLGTITAQWLRHTPPSSPELRFRLDMLAIPTSIWHLLKHDGALRNALMASTTFWLVAAIVQPSVNALGKRQLLPDHTPAAADLWTSLLVTSISAGIALGSVLAGYLSRGRVNAGVQATGAAGMCVMLVLLALPGGPHQQLLDYFGSMAGLVFLGLFTGMFAVPLQVFLQMRPPANEKGRMIATQNLLNWIGIFASAGLYWLGDKLLDAVGWPPSAMFALTAVIILPVALFYRPPSAAT